MRFFRPVPSVIFLSLAGALLVTNCGKTADTALPAATGSGSGTGSEIVQSAGSLNLNIVPSIVLASVTGGSGGTALTETTEAALDSADPKTATAALDKVFADATDIKGCLVGLGRTAPAGAGAECYGPSVVTKHHPDWTAGMPADQENAFLPSGDIGIFDAANQGSGEACIAAKMNSLTASTRSRVKEAIETGKRVLCFAKVLGKTLPTTVGEKLDLTADVTTALAAVTDNEHVKDLSFNAIQITLSKENVYQTDVDANIPAGTLWTRVVVESVDENNSNGYVWGVFNRTASGPNLAGTGSGSGSGLGSGMPSGSGSGMPSGSGSGNAAQAEVNVFSVIFKKTGDMLSYDATKSVAQSDADKAALQADKAALFEADKRVRVASTGNPGYDQALAKIDTATGVGEMAYFWTAGGAQEEQRTMHAKTVIGDGDVKTGWGYFGFGKKLTDFRALVKAGNIPAGTQSVEKMICNWAGPNNSHTGIAFAQRQEFEMVSGVFKPTVNNIGFAAQKSCGQTDYTTNYTVAKGMNAASVTDADYHAWPTFDLAPIDDDAKADLGTIADLVVDTSL